MDKFTDQFSLYPFLVEFRKIYGKYLFGKALLKYSPFPLSFIVQTPGLSSQRADTSSFSSLLGEQCFLNELPIEVFDHSATVIDDVPIFCGGLTNYHEQLGCFTYDVATDSWNKVDP